MDRITLTDGITGEILEIPTANPTGFYQAITEPENMPAARIFGQLFLPAGSTPHGVVIVVPGSLGIAPSHIAKADMLTHAGIGACLIDPFGQRGVTSTVADQTQYTFAASAWDVLATARMLCARADVDASRIGAQGHSRGGAAVLSAACMTRLTGIPEHPLCAVYGAYPWSGQQFENPEVGNTRVRSIIGDRDEWCLPQQVQAHMHAVRLTGGNASCRIVAGAQHSFDRDTPIELIEDASVSPSAPTVYIADDGALIHPLTGIADPTLSERELMIYAVKAGYGAKGARIGSEGDQAAVFNADMMSFWQEVMSR